MKRYYFIVKFLPKDANLALLTGRCISVMHGFICNHSIQGLGVSFPAWSDASIGHMIAFVHTDMDALKELSQQDYFQNMQEYGFFSVGNVQEVPDDCAEVRFKRNQNIAKIFVGEARRRLRRLEKRALARGEVFNPNKNTEPRVREAFHRIAMRSGKSKQDYLLHIQRAMVRERSEPVFNSYGFATNIQLNGTVPDLSYLVETI